MNLQILLDQVLPEGSILYKHNHGMFSFYKDDRAFEDGRDYLTQKSDDTVHGFLEELIEKLCKEEQDSNDPDPLVSIDKAIWEHRELGDI